MSNTIEVTLDCGCAVTLRQEWEHGCAGDCHPAVEVIAAGEITAPCPQHDSLESDIEEVKAEREDLALQLSNMDSRVEQLDAERCDFDCPRCATGEVPSRAAQWTGTGDTVSLEEAFDER